MEFNMTAITITVVICLTVLAICWLNKGGRK